VQCARRRVPRFPRCWRAVRVPTSNRARPRSPSYRPLPV
jgi:hypothetical protein